MRLTAVRLTVTMYAREVQGLVYIRALIREVGPNVDSSAIEFLYVVVSPWYILIVFV